MVVGIETSGESARGQRPMAIMRTRRIMVWVAICAGLFSLPLVHPFDRPAERAEARRQRAFHRRLAEIHAGKASECRRLEPLARLRGDFKEADLLAKAARRYQEISNYHAR